MINSISELKDLILWAKSEKLKSLKLNGVEIEFSDISLLESVVLPDAAPATEPEITQTPQTAENDELLYWSAR